MRRNHRALLGLGLCACGLALGCTASEPVASKSSAKLQAAPPPSAAAEPLVAVAQPVAAAVAVAAQPEAVEPVAAPAAAAVPAAAPEYFAGTSLRQDYILEQLASAPMLGFRAVGSTSTVFRTALKSPIVAALKVATSRRPRGPQAELASYRLARMLRLANVPPVTSRRVAARVLRGGLASDQAAQWPDIEQRLIVDRMGMVPGAAIYWVDGMQDTGLETAAGQARIAHWLDLAQPLPPQEDSTLAAQVSTMIAFDYLIGNWDRWSGGNIKADASGKLLYLRDHDAGMPAHLSEALHRRMLDRLTTTQRFSRGFYEALQALARAAYEQDLASLGNEPGPVLDSHRLDGLFDRRETLLSHVATLIEEHGAEQVLAFP